MPLLDHFHSPLAPRHNWEAVHTRWTSSLADALNEDLLPKGFFAEPQTHVGTHLEIDVITWEEEGATQGGDRDGAATATMPAKVWTPPAAPLCLAASFPETFEVRIFGELPGGVRLVSAIELVSPRNKDRPDARRSFAIKAASYLIQGISLLMVDTITERRANLHNEMMGLLEAPDPFRLAPEVFLYATACRPVLRQEKPEIDIWPEVLAVGSRLPVLPLGLTHGLCVPVDLESTYTDACRRLRLV